MKPALAVVALLFAASGGVAAETTGKATPPAAQEKQQVKTRPAPPGDAKPAEEEAFVPGGMPKSFVIPKNTCEQGSPLQKLLRDKPK